MINNNIKNIEVFAVEDFNDRGNHRSKGFIYSIEENYAEMYIEEKKVIKVKNDQLDRIEKDLKELKDKMTEEIASIKENTRLSDLAIKEDVESAELAYQAEAESLQELYTKKLDELIEEAEKKINEAPGDTKDSYEARTQAGIITSSLTVESDFFSAVNSFKQRVNFIDTSTAREILANFLSIKTELGTKEIGESTIDAVNYKREIKELYDLLVDKSYSEEQKKVKLELDMLYAIKKFRSNILFEFNMYSTIKRVLK